MSRVRLEDDSPRCDYCGEPFTPYRPGQRFCPGGECRMAYHRAQIRLHRAERGKNTVTEAAAILGRLGGLATARKRKKAE